MRRIVDGFCSVTKLPDKSNPYTIHTSFIHAAGTASLDYVNNCGYFVLCGNHKGFFSFMGQKYVHHRVLEDSEIHTFTVPFAAIAHTLINHSFQHTATNSFVPCIVWKIAESVKHYSGLTIIKTVLSSLGVTVLSS